jgi:transposase InsO family protein
VHIQGHFGCARTQAAFADKFFFPRWKQFINRTVAQCEECIRRKGPHSRAVMPIKRYHASSPLQRIAVDVMGPLPTTERGNKYIVVITDYFTKWIECYATPNQEATTIADLLIDQFISRFGVPLEIHSDMGRNFESNLVSLICAKLGINKTRTTPYRPQSDGQTERFNRTLLDALAKCSDSQTNWDLNIPLLCLYYRATVHASTGTTPALLMLGRELRLPVHLIFPPTEVSSSESYPEYVDKLEERIQMASEYARKHLNLAYERMKLSSDPSRVPKELDISRDVFVFNPAVKKGQSSKLSSCWKGPFKILEKITPYLYRIAIAGRRGTQVMHRYHLYQPNL